MPLFSSLNLPEVGPWPRRLVASLCLVLAAFLAVRPHQRPPVSPAAATFSVVVAAASLPPGATLTRKDLALARWPRAVAIDATSHDISPLVGRRLTSAVARGEPITASRLVGRDLAAALPRGQVAVPVPAAGEGTTALVRAGDRVTLLAVPSDADSATEDLPRGSPAANGVSADRSGAASARGTPSVATALLVLAVLPPASVDADADRATATLILAMTPETAAHIATYLARPLLAVRDDRP